MPHVFVSTGPADPPNGYPGAVIGQLQPFLVFCAELVATNIKNA